MSRSKKQFTLTGRHAGAFKKLDSLRSRIARLKAKFEKAVDPLVAQERGASARCLDLMNRARIDTYEFVTATAEGEVTRKAAKVSPVKHCINVEAFERVCEGVIPREQVTAAIERSVDFKVAKEMLDADALNRCDQPSLGAAYIRITGNRGRAADQE